MQPLLNRLKAGYQGPASSAEYNELRETLYFDILNLYNISTRHQIDIENNMDILVRENFFMQNKILQVEGLLATMQQTVDNRNQLKFGYQSFTSYNGFSYSLPNIINIPIENQLEIDILNRVGLAPKTAAFNKIYMINNTGEKFLPNELVVTVHEGLTANALFDINSTGVYRAFDGDRANTWMRTVKTEPNVNEIHARIDIKLPLNIANNPLINNIVIHPSPEFSFSITNIQYRNAGGAWQTISTYPTVNGQPIEIKEFTNTRFIFPDVEATDVRIHIKQPSWFAEDNKRVFVYGFQSIEASYEKYTTQASSIITKFNIESSGRTFHTIHPPVVETSLGSIKNITPFLSHALYYRRIIAGNTSHIPIAFGTRIDSSQCNEIHIVTTLTPQGSASPALKSISVPFTTN